MTERITKLQRWLDLIAYLVGRRYPVTVDQIMEAVPAYASALSGDATADASVRRMFERDKEELRALGIPIETVTFRIEGVEETEGYRIARGDFYLPYLRLIGGATPSEKDRPEGTRPKAGIGELEIRPEEARTARDALALVTAMPGFLFRDEARSAHRKLAFDLGPRGPDAVLAVERPGSEEVRDRLRMLNEALQARKHVRFRYHGIYRGEATDRDVAPYGLLFQSGQWYLVGHDALRDDLRVFRVDRMEKIEPNRNAPKTPDFSVPDDFDLAAYRDRRAWELGDEESPIEARVRFRFPTSLWAERNGYGELVAEETDGASVRRFSVHQVNPFLRWILGLAGEAEILAPAEVRREFAVLLDRVGALYGEAG